MNRASIILLAGLAVAAAAQPAGAGADEGAVPSADGTAIRYAAEGAGEPALVFIHCWCCDRGYWKKQVPHFAKNHRVVTLDLAGHGDSGRERGEWTVRSFAGDMASAPPEVGIGAMRSLLAYDPEGALEKLAIPIRNINGGKWQTNIEGNRKLYGDYDARIMAGLGHFPHIEAPERFNALLEATIREIAAGERPAR